MAEIESKTVLCPGCPITGNFVGEVTAESIAFTTETLRDLGPFNMIRNYTEGSITDGDGMTSEPIAIFPGMIGINSKMLADRNTEKLNKNTAKIVDRVSRCIGHTATFKSESGENVAEQRSCPAINAQVLGLLIGKDQ